MERLTQRTNGVVVYVGAHNEETGGQIPCEVGPQGVREILARLAAYEDTGLTPENCAEYRKFEGEIIASGKTVGRLVDLLKADKEGRAMVLPCKVGDAVWIAGSVRGMYSATVRTFFCGHPSAVRGADDDGYIQMIRTTECDIPKGGLRMAEYITKEALRAFPIRANHCDKEHANEHFISGIETVMEYAENLPAADVAPVVHGRWLKHYRSGVTVAEGYVSSCCDMWNERESHYCPNCGAKMYGGVDDAAD